MPVELVVNGKSVAVDCDPTTPLLWVLRDHLHLPGTKYGCGVGQCGACTVHLEGTGVRSCTTPLVAIEGKKVTTIEGLQGREADALRVADLDNDSYMELYVAGSSGLWRFVRPGEELQ